MAKFRVNTRSFVNNALAEEGTVIEYAGEVADNLDPIDDAALEVVKASGQANVRSIARQRAAAIGGNPDSQEAAAAISAAAAAAASTLSQAASLV